MFVNVDAEHEIVSASPAMLPFLIESDREAFAEHQHSLQPWTELQWRGVMALSCDPANPDLIAVAVERVNPQHMIIKGWAVWTLDQGEMRLQKIFVAKTARGMHIGRQLLCQQWNAPINLFADVHERDLQSQRFFKASGWQGKAACHLDGDGIIRFRPTRPPQQPVALLPLPSAENSRAKKRKEDKELN